MKTAFLKVNINPQLPVLLSGFGKKRISTNIHDDLFARVFLFDDQGKEIIWIQLDLVAIDQDFMNLFMKKTGLTENQIIISATHTHSGPGGTLNTTNGLLKGMGSVFGGEHNPAYCEEIVDQLQEALQTCRKQLEETKISIAYGKVTGLGTERHDATLECDQDSLLIELHTPTQKALIVRLACHPTVMDANNLEITADYCGQIEPHFFDYACVAVVNGSAGDMSTRFTRQQSNFAECERYGTLVSHQLKELLNTKTYFTNFTMQLHHTRFNVKVRETDPIEVAMEKLKKAELAVEEAKKANVSAKELRIVQSFFEGAQNNILASMSLKGATEMSVPVSALKIADWTLIFTPFELFSKLSNPYKIGNTEFVGYTNGYYLYLPDTTAFEKEFYEASSSMFAKGSGEELMKQIHDWFIHL